jgi:site-specific DNA-methyltransferase (adenine-specific)
MRREIPDASIQLTVTSPPYDNLRKYNGFTWDFEAVARELYRVTKPGGVVMWNVNDSTLDGSETCTSFHQAIYFKESCGFNLHDTMIYAKLNPTPYHHNRYNPSWEYMFVFSKGKPSTFNPIQTQTQTQKKRTGKYRYPDGSLREANTPIAQEWKMLDNIFYYSVGTDRECKEHPAKFPQQLALDHILSWSNPGDTVLDPFVGSGTTGKMAVLNGREFIGIDISPEYVALATGRINAAQKEDTI